MKNLFAIIFFACLACPSGAQIFYLQPFTGGSFPTGWGPSSRTVLSNQSPSSNYTMPPFSAGNNVRFDNCLPTGETVTLSVSSVISTIGKSNIRVGFGRRMSSAWVPAMVFEWSNNGSTWNIISTDVRPISSDTWDYVFFDLPSGADNVANLRFRFSFVTNTTFSCTFPPNFRIDDFAVGSNFSLPVELSQFDVQGVRERVQLKWTTRTETDNAYFAVEHSANGQDFIELGQLSAYGTTIEPQQYSFWHQNPEPGLNYYRLRQVDWNDNITYSPIRIINLAHDFALQVSPSPASDYLRVVWEKSLLPETGTWEIYDTRGLRLRSGPVVDQEEPELNISLQELPPGRYLLQLCLSRKLMVQCFYKV